MVCHSTEQLCQPRFVGVARGTIAVRLDPFRVLRAKIIVNLLFQFGVSIPFV